MSNEIVKSPMLMLQEQLDKGVSVETLKGLMDLAERYDKIQAEKAWNHAMTACQRDMPALLKTSHNTHKNIWYAGFEQLDRQIRPIYLREGFSLCFTELEHPDKEICHMALDILHVDGHCRRTEKKVHIDGVGIKGNANMTATQADGSTTSYARRYVTKMAFNLRDALDEDLDGDARKRVISAEEVEAVDTLMKEISYFSGTPFQRGPFLNWLVEGLEVVEELPSDKLVQAMMELNRKRQEAIRSKKK